MIEVFGWIVLVLMTFVGTVVYVILCTQTLGSYNIGGVPTSKLGKVLTICLGVLLAWWWSKVFDWSPFVLSIQ